MKVGDRFAEFEMVMKMAVALERFIVDEALYDRDGSCLIQIADTLAYFSMKEILDQATAEKIDSLDEEEIDRRMKDVLGIDYDRRILK